MGKEARTNKLCFFNNMQKLLQTAETDLRGTFLPQKTNTVNAIS